MTAFFQGITLTLDQDTTSSATTTPPPSIPRSGLAGKAPTLSPACHSGLFHLAQQVGRGSASSSTPFAVVYSQCRDLIRRTDEYDSHYTRKRPFIWTNIAGVHPRQSWFRRWDRTLGQRLQKISR